jgi:hypothetical protein
LFTLVFFTVARNVLWTYVLPAMPAFAILLGEHIDRWWLSKRSTSIAVATAWLVPVVGLVVAVLLTMRPTLLRTERDLVAFAQGLPHQEEPLLYVDKRPFSARYYSHGQADLVSMADLPARLAQATTDIHLAVPKEELAHVEALLGGSATQQFRSQLFVLLTVAPHR